MQITNSKAIIPQIYAKRTETPVRETAAARHGRAIGLYNSATSGRFRSPICFLFTFNRISFISTYLLGTIIDQ